MFLNMKTNYHENIHDRATGMKSRIVGHRFLTQA